MSLSRSVFICARPICAVLGGAILVALGCSSDKSSDPSSGGGNSPCTAIIGDSPPPPAHYPKHDNIVATTFWVGEEESADNGFIQNTASAWDPNWATRYGGVDKPDQRSGYCPGTFIPKENPFYIALPYNDIEESGARRKDAPTVIPWFAEATAGDKNKPTTFSDGAVLLKSAVEHRWVEVTQADRRCYGQWEDAGPFGEDDSAYVFGTAPPKNTDGEKAGLDLSPAMATCLNIDGTGTVSWRFVDEKEVPVGPWTVKITRRAP